MHKTSEGMRRLAIGLGTVAAATWIVFVAIASEGFALVQPREWLIVLIGIPITFGVPFLAIWGIDWIFAGFRRDRGRW